LSTLSVIDENGKLIGIVEATAIWALVICNR
jgi:CBS-domain-containing membrane protein